MGRRVVLISGHRLRILLADDHPLILSSVRRVLTGEGQFEVVGEATRGGQVLRLVDELRPDVVLLDLRLPEVDGLVCLDQIKRRYPDVRVIILSVSSDEKLIANVLKRGADGYIVKSVNPIDIPAVIRQVIEGTVYTPAALANSEQGTASAASAVGLTTRELAILEALAAGMSNQAIAKRLWVAPQTVKFHLTNIYRKLGVANRTEAARYAYQHGLVAAPALDPVDHEHGRPAE